MHQDDTQDLKEFEEYIEHKELEEDILVKIWTRPRRCFSFINDMKYEKHMWMLLVLAGISNAFDRASRNGSGDNTSVAGIIGMSIIIGGLIGWISFYIYAALLSWTGQLVKGKGNTKAIVRMLAYASVPVIVSLLALVVQMVVFGNEIFKSEPDIYSFGNVGVIIYFSMAFIEVVLGCWTIVLVVIGLSEVQKISIWKSILNVLFPILLIVVPLLVIYMSTSGFSIF